ncbi:MAG TPA: TIGR03619 family F420-dependent LLM class oxidoreductase [Acidimicrobiales bacterium]
MTDSTSLLGFTMQLPVQAQSTLIAQPWEPAAGPAELAAVARACDANGFYSVSVCDHVAIPRERAPAMTTTWYDTVATLGWLAGFTGNVRLLSHVYVVAYRHPLQTAKAFATLDTLSGGRAILGVGAGHVEGEFDALGVPFAQRGRITDEAVVAIRAALADEWGGGDVGQQPRPVQPDGPPIWVGGSSGAALRRAARLGDGWLPQGPPEGGMATAIATLQRLRTEAGRAGPFAIGGGVSLYVGQPSFEVPRWTVTGDPDRLAEAVRDLVALGVNHVAIRIPSRSCEEHIDQIAAFGRDVAPLVED